MRELIEKIYKENRLDRHELITVISQIRQSGLEEVLLRYALTTKIGMYGSRVFMRGLIEFSNYCRRDCLYCGIRASNCKAQRYRLSPEDILHCCREGYALGYRTFVLQSGEDPWYTEAKLCALIHDIKEQFPDAAVTLSIGERSYAEYLSFYNAGADRFLLRHETASRRLYEQLHPSGSFDERRRCLYQLKEIGYQVGAGFMVGLPGQTAEDLAEDLLFIKELEPDMIGIGPFIPHGQTPLSDAAPGTAVDTLLMVALSRLLLPGANIPATTALGTLDPKGREKALKAGANVVMPNLTPTGQRAKYALYENKICTGDLAAHCRFCIESIIQAAGFDVDMGRGDSARIACQS